LKLIIIQLIAAVIIPGIMPKIFKDFAGFDFKQKEKREIYINTLIDHYFE